MSATPVTIANARLTTAHVTIQTIQVSGKQMTLAVFRQLPVDVPEADDTIWGWVNYEVDGSKQHAVFEADGDLYRMPLGDQLHGYVLEPGEQPDPRQIFVLRWPQLYIAV